VPVEYGAADTVGHTYPMSSSSTGLTVAVTGPTGTFGAGLVPLLEADDRVDRIVGIARRPFDPASRGWTKMTYREGDVREPEALRDAFEGADVVVHLAFLIVGGERTTTRAINVEGTLNAFRAAAAVGAKRFVYSSSVAAYGFHRDNPVGMTEQWPVRPADRLFYSQEKAEIENLLEREAASHPELALYVLRPPGVLGPNAVGAKNVLPEPVMRIARPMRGLIRRPPIPVPILVPNIPVQLIHEADVGSALLQCVVAAGPPGSYNIAGDDTPTLVDIARVLGLHPIAVSPRSTFAVARLLSRLPLSSFGQWLEALSHPAVMDTTKAKTELHWKPQYSGLDAVRATLS